MTRGERAAVRFVRELIPKSALAVIGGPRRPRTSVCSPPVVETCGSQRPIARLPQSV